MRAITLSLWIKGTGYTTSQTVLWTENNLYDIQFTNTSKTIRIKKSANSHHSFTNNEEPAHKWTYCAASFGQYSDTNFVIGKKFSVYNDHSETMLSQNHRYAYLGVNSRNTYLKEMAIWTADHLSIAELMRNQYKTFGFDNKYIRMYWDMKTDGYVSHTTDPLDQHLRCPMSTRMDEEHAYCIQTGSLCIEKTLTLNSSYMGVQTEGTIEVAFKVLKWGNNNMTILAIGNIINVQILKTNYRLLLTGLTTSNEKKFEESPTWVILLGTQYHLAFTFTANSLDVYLNRLKESFVIVIYVSYI